EIPHLYPEYPRPVAHAAPAGSAPAGPGFETATGSFLVFPSSFPWSCLLRVRLRFEARRLAACLFHFDAPALGLWSFRYCDLQDPVLQGSRHPIRVDLAGKLDRSG